MRAGFTVLTLAASWQLCCTNPGHAAPMSYTQQQSTSSVLANGGQSACNECDPCANANKHHGIGGGRRSNNNRAPDWANCNCNGSYKFPVPPLYTYHWPGRYSQQLMTDYHSPWRFPPLKPYTDEVRPPANGGAVVPTSATTISREPESLSEKIIRHYELR